MITLSAIPPKKSFLEINQTNLSLTGSQFSKFWGCLFSSPYSSHPRILHCSKSLMFCFHWWWIIHQETDFRYQIPLMSKFPVLSISLSSAKSGQHPNRKVPCFTNKVLEWYKHITNSQFCSFCRQSSVHSSANYIHCSVKLSVLISQFTIIHNSHPKCFHMSN